MLVRIQGIASVAKRGKPVTDAKTIKALHGAESKDECADYIDTALAALGIEGGRVRLTHAYKGFVVTTEYTAPKKLTAAELQKLVADTQGQWSDGIGEECFDALAEKLKVDIDLCPEGQKPTAEQAGEDKPAGKKPNKLALPKAAMEGDLAKVREFLDAGADTEALFQKHTALLLAVLYAHPQIALLLIEKGAKLSARCPQGWDALVLCGQARELKDEPAARIARALLERGAKANGKRGSQYMYKKSPLQAAANKPTLQAVLREFGAAA
ncbi:MAG TPA: ankyrin repeat domain-containing protein [Urbifossiella sp.]|nr:ankyrin repeat domain-containing protein [Urbifossiella sp.]